MPAIAWLAIAWLAVGIGVAVLALAVWWVITRRARRTVPADVEPTPDAEPAVEPVAELVAVAVPVSVEAPEVWQAPAPTPTTATADDNSVIWTPNRARADAAYFHQIDDLLAQYLPDASVSDAFIFEDKEGRWIASKCWNFATRTFELGRAPIPATETLP